MLLWMHLFLFEIHNKTNVCPSLGKTGNAICIKRVDGNKIHVILEWCHMGVKAPKKTDNLTVSSTACAGIILCILSHCNLPLIGWLHTQNDPCLCKLSTSKKISKLHITGPLWGEPTGNPYIPFTKMQKVFPGPRLNIKTVLSTYGDFHVKDKTAVRTSYL